MILYLIFISCFFSSVSLADTVEERNFIIEAKLGILPSIQVMEIKTKLNMKDNNFNYIFNIKSKNIVNFINETNGKGIVDGVFTNDNFRPTKYSYSYTRKDKDKFVEIIYANNGVQSLVVKPDYDKSKLTPLPETLLDGTIDPPTFFLNLLNYKNTNLCKKTFKIFDGKRRYNVEFSQSELSEKGLIQCKAMQVKLGGYKQKEKDIFASSDYINVIYQDNETNKFLQYEARNGSVKIIIKESKTKK